MAGRFVALDWGTSSFRAYLADSAGRVLEEVSSSDGILTVTGGQFEAVFERVMARFDAGLPVLASGMITSRQGWVEVPYVACPAGVDELVRGLRVQRTAAGRTIHFVPGLSCETAAGIPDVLRGEETQVFGSLAGGATHYVTPGTHSKWITTAGPRITGFATYMTGEVFALLRHQSILGRLAVDEREDEAAFRRGVKEALADPAGLLHRIFAARTLVLFDRMAPGSVPSYLSGQVIGTEVAHAIAQAPRDADYCVLASAANGARYVTALAMAGLTARLGNTAAAVHGLAEIGRRAGLIR
jgi:2-dehydro-3-deoxygalactonokinase